MTKKLKEYLTLIGMVVAIIGTIWARYDAQNQLNDRVSEISKQVLAQQAFQDSLEKESLVRAAVRAWIREHGDHRQPTQSEIVGVLADSSKAFVAANPKVVDSLAKEGRRTARLKSWAQMKK